VPSNQCLWCEYYEESEDVIKLGKNGNNLEFNFTYIDNSNIALDSYDFILTADNVSDPTLATNKIELLNNRTSVPSGTVLKIAGFSMVRGSLNSALKQIPYDGKTYNWWVRVKNVLGTQSNWVKSDRPFTTEDHHWPKVAVVSEPVIANVPTQFCSTAKDATDPCINLCWVKSSVVNGVTNQNFSFTNQYLQSMQLASSAWKCSVCYDSDGDEILCQNSSNVVANRFEWGVEDPEVTTTYAPVFPTVNTVSVQSWWKYGASIANGDIAYNPVIQFKQKPTGSAKVKLKVYGSSCPLAVSPIAKTIRPIWIER
jgi:hypothetical protein